MSSEQICKWVITSDWGGTPFVYCSHPRGYDRACTMSIEEAEAILNEHAELKRENERLVEAGKGMLDLADSYKENGLPIIFPYADEIIAMKKALLTPEDHDDQT